jgi:hypothetical protein
MRCGSCGLVNFQGQDPCKRCGAPVPRELENPVEPEKPKCVEYLVLASEEPQASYKHLQGEVNKALADGWKVQGGLAISRSGRWVSFYQALVKEPVFQ